MKRTCVPYLRLRLYAGRWDVADLDEGLGVVIVIVLLLWFLLVRDDHHRLHVFGQRGRVQEVRRGLTRGQRKGRYWLNTATLWDHVQVKYLQKKEWKIVFNEKTITWNLSRMQLSVQIRSFLQCDSTDSSLWHSRWRLWLSTEVIPPLPIPLCSYIRQFGNLDESLEVHHVSGFIEEGLKAVGQITTRYSSHTRALATGSIQSHVSWKNEACLSLSDALKDIRSIR